MSRHIDLLGYMSIAYGLFGAIAGLLVGFAMGGIGILTGDAQAAGILSLIGFGVGTFLLVVSLPALIAGYGLIKRLSWARILTIVLAVLSLPSVPIGTAYGIYALWVLFQPESEATFA